MKIRTDQVDALQQQEEVRKKQQPAEGFDQLLTQELGRQDATGQAKAAVPPPGAGAVVLNPLAMTEAVGKTEAVQATGSATEQVAASLGNMLDQMDTYTRQLNARPDADLKGAFATLESVSGGLAALKEQHADVAERAPELRAVMNELEVMTVTERFKMNRGDYIA